MAKVVSDADRVGHLLRRFGFGSSQKERAAYAGLSPDALLEKLLRPEHSGSDIPPLRSAFVKGEEAQPGAWRFRMLWFYEMITTAHPLREKAALFWHNHFACSGEKTEDGLAMLEYMQILRKQPLGSFTEILRSMVTSVAVMKQLDVQMLGRANPNENFARELLELYTTGVGPYTEDDIKALSFVLTGHGYVDVFWGLGDTNDKRLMRMMRDDSWGSAYCYVPALHDPRPRTVLGKEVHNLDEAVEHLANHPKTAEFVCTKLWRFFGSPKVEPKAVAAMVRAWKRSGGVISEVLKEMARTKEFWDEAVVRQLPKNPVEFVVGIARAQDAGTELKGFFKPGLPNQPLPPELEGPLAEAAWHCTLIGWDMLNIPSVAGYDGGSEWISTDSMLRKGNYHGIRTAESYQEKKETKWRPARNLMTVADYVLKSKPNTTLDYARAVNEFYDAGLDGKQLETLAKVVQKHGGMEPLKHREWLGWQVAEVFKMVRLTPEFSLC